MRERSALAHTAAVRDARRTHTHERAARGRSSLACADSVVRDAHGSHAQEGSARALVARACPV
eukprot:2060413-Pleurochrysis_carterae.AAC.1